MRTRNSTSVFLASILILCLAAPPVHAQYFIVKDSTCTVATTCGGQSGHGCVSTTFQVGSSATYTLTATMEGCGPTAICGNCVSEAYVYDATAQEVGCVHNSCGCTTQSIGITLTAGETYTLYSCKLACVPNNGCANCPNSCVAVATVPDFPQP